MSDTGKLPPLDDYMSKVNGTEYVIARNNLLPVVGTMGQALPSHFTKHRHGINNNADIQKAHESMLDAIINDVNRRYLEIGESVDYNRLLDESGCIFSIALFLVNSYKTNVIVNPNGDGFIAIRVFDLDDVTKRVQEELNLKNTFQNHYETINACIRRTFTYGIDLEFNNALPNHTEPVIFYTYDANMGMQYSWQLGESVVIFDPFSNTIRAELHVKRIDGKPLKGKWHNIEEPEQVDLDF